MIEGTLIDMLCEDQELGYRQERSRARLAAAWRIGRRFRCNKGPMGAFVAIARSADPESIDQRRQAGIAADQGLCADFTHCE